VNRQLGVLPHRPLLVDDPFDHFGTPYAAGVMVELQRRGIPFVGKEPSLVARYGPRRRFNGHNASTALVMRTGDAALVAPPGTRRVALAEGLGRREREELLNLQASVRDFLMREGVRLTPGGERTARLGGLANFTPTLTVQYPNVDALLASSELVSMVENHYLVLNATWRQVFARYAALQQAWDRGTVALFVGPLGPGGRIPGRG